jgi:copper(I)-binding protein
VSRMVRIRPTAAALVGAVAAAVTLAGCGAGQITQTDTQLSAVDGANVQVGTIALRDSVIEFNDRAEGAAVYPRGGSAPLSMSIVNAGSQADRLVSVSSPIATSVQITGTSDLPAGQRLLVEGTPPAPAAPALPAAPGAPAVPGAPAAPGAPATPGAPAAPGTPAAPGAPAATTAPPAPGGSTPPPATPPVSGGMREANIVLTGLREDITAGPTYPVTFTFEHAGQIQVPVPVQNPSGPRENAAE